MATGDLADKVARIVGGVGGRSVRMLNQMVESEQISAAVPRRQDDQDHINSHEPQYEVGKSGTIRK